ncbi:MAG: mechanosensitive ion channel protein MscS [Ignavibacteriae bacterium HGW-Ignavibacteriae-2]|jgi:miniconductance mechanosensitive channel|nr:mechanosensitive ion channel family protein [Bacteroidota bacterium]PKL88901.1 MAG: mechanosensitive ion channel protein MscS [Ignavibacteriae bacterium HGW-Ignavibacteriae-2]
MFDFVKEWFKDYPTLINGLEITGIIILAFMSHFAVKSILYKSIQKLTQKTKTEFDDILLNKNLLRRVSYIAPLIVINQFSYLLPDLNKFLSNLSGALTAFIVVLIITSILTSINEIYENMSKDFKRPIKGYIQVIKIILYVIGAIIIVGILTGQSIFELLAGIGALTAVLMFVFKDTILSFIASVQITSYDLVKIGDWIEIPSLGVDGDIMDIALHTIKVRNFDKTITTVPTYKLIEVPFKNWRGMQETGGRRIKRSIHIDLASVKFCDEKMITKFKKFQLLQPYIDKKLNDIENFNKQNKIDSSEQVNGRRLTNIGTFRGYIKEYLNHRNDISKELTFLVRQLEPKEHGIPIEIYVFTTTTKWVEYEEIQSDIFDHIFAIIPFFELQVFQTPSGADIRSLAGTKLIS